MDFSQFTSRPATSGSTYDGKDRWTTDPGGEAKLVEALMKLHFPEAAAMAGSARLSAKEPGRGADASTGGLGPSGEVRVGERFFRPVTTYDKAPGVRGLETPAVLEKLMTLLHEGYHVRSEHAPGVKQGLPDHREWVPLLQNAKAARFPSIDKHLFQGDNLEEFLATAVPLDQWQKTTIGPTTGRYQGMDKALDQMKGLQPWLTKWLEHNSRPEILPSTLRSR